MLNGKSESLLMSPNCLKSRKNSRNYQFVGKIEPSKSFLGSLNFSILRKSKKKTFFFSQSQLQMQLSQLRLKQNRKALFKIYLLSVPNFTVRIRSSIKITGIRKLSVLQGLNLLDQYRKSYKFKNEEEKRNKENQLFI